jgi:predicted aconitase
MMGNKMELTDEEKDILEGKKGNTLKKVMETIVLYGQTFGAKRLIPVSGPVHLVTSFGIPILVPVFEMMDDLIKNDIKTELPFTVDPRPIDYENVKCNLLQKMVFKIMYGKQEYYEKQLKSVGLKDNNAFTCTCYMNEVGNIPQYGDVISWAESSAVVYANSVIGARCNRNSGIIELFGGIIGKVPEFGLLTDEGRQAEWIIELNTTNLPDAQVLGSAVGMKVMEDVPYIKGLDRFLGNELNDKAKDYLKDMGAATASNGAVGLYHVDNLTPEAVNHGQKLIKENAKKYVIDDEEIQRIIDSYPVMWKNKDAEPKICFIGCPHLSLSQMHHWTTKIKNSLKKASRDKVKITTILTSAPDVIEKFKNDGNDYNDLINMGIKITSICPLMYMNNPMCSKQPVITNSNKLRTYTTARYYVDDEIVHIITGGK